MAPFPNTVVWVLIFLKLWMVRILPANLIGTSIKCAFNYGIIMV